MRFYCNNNRLYSSSRDLQKSGQFLELKLWGEKNPNKVDTSHEADRSGRDVRAVGPCLLASCSAPCIQTNTDLDLELKSSGWIHTLLKLTGASPVTWHRGVTLSSQGMSQVHVNTIKWLETAPGFARDISVRGTRTHFPWFARARHVQPRREEVLTWGWLLAEEHGSSQHVVRLRARTDGESKSPVLMMGREEAFASNIRRAKAGPIPLQGLSCLSRATLRCNVPERRISKAPRKYKSTSTATDATGR